MYYTAVQSLINIAKGGIFYPSKKEAADTIRILINKNIENKKSLIIDSDFAERLKEILDS